MGLFDAGGLDFTFPSDFVSTGGGGWSLPSPSFLDSTAGSPSFLGGTPSLGDQAAMAWGGGGGGGGGFSFPSLDTLGKAVRIGSDVLQAGGGIYSAIQNANYQKSLQDYYSQRAKAEAAYNQQVQDYLTQRAQWEGQLFGQFGEQEQSLQDALTTFQGQVTDVFNQEMAAAQPLLQQGQQLTSEGVAALAKGQVPPD